jgi:hypothetical protein
MAESLPWSPHWEFGISHWQLVTKLHYLSGKRKTCAGVLARPPSRLLLEIDVGQRLPISVATMKQASVSSAVHGGGKRLAGVVVAAPKHPFQL